MLKVIQYIVWAYAYSAKKIQEIKIRNGKKI